MGLRIIKSQPDMLKEAYAKILEKRAEILALAHRLGGESDQEYQELLEKMNRISETLEDDQAAMALALKLEESIRKAKDHAPIKIDSLGPARAFELL